MSEAIPREHFWLSSSSRQESYFYLLSCSSSISSPDCIKVFNRTQQKRFNRKKTSKSPFLHGLGSLLEGRKPTLKPFLAAKALKHCLDKSPSTRLLLRWQWGLFLSQKKSHSIRLSQLEELSSLLVSKYPQRKEKKIGCLQRKCALLLLTWPRTGWSRECYSLIFTQVISRDSANNASQDHTKETWIIKHLWTRKCSSPCIGH